jgi:phosphatidylethanolamine/phosphatidyl-N-methylethanolamine N-methyltransferase
MTRFLSAFLRHPIATGAIAPSSTHLAIEMVNWVDWNSVNVCVEFGPGTGAFTPHILDSMRKGTRFFAIELNPKFAEMMTGKFPHVETICRSVADIEAICDERGVAKIDCIICGLPWAAFAANLQRCLMNAVLARMSEGGYFATFAYLQGTVLPAGLRFTKLLQESFGEVRRSRIVWRNLPPAFVYRCRKS